jgi:hypothetical protein
LRFVLRLKRDEGAEVFLLSRYLMETFSNDDMKFASVVHFPPAEAKTAIGRNPTPAGRSPSARDPSPALEVSRFGINNRSDPGFPER